MMALMMPPLGLGTFLVKGEIKKGGKVMNKRENKNTSEQRQY